VDQVQVEVVQFQVGQGFVECVQRRFVALRAVPHLAGYEQLFAVGAALADGFADALFVAVDGSRVDMPVTRMDGLDDRTDGRFAVRRQVGAETDAGYLHAVAQRKRVFQRFE